MSEPDTKEKPIVIKTEIKTLSDGVEYNVRDYRPLFRELRKERGKKK